MHLLRILPPEGRIRTEAILRACIPFLIGMFFALSALPPGSAEEEERRPSKAIRISAIENEQTHAIAKHVLEEAYRRIGYEVRFDDLPGRRALEWADSGLTDGDVARIEGTEHKFPNLLRVKVPVIHFRGVAFAKTVDRPVHCWEDLEGLRIGVVRGIRYSTLGTEGMSPYFANDMTHLFTILDMGRIEVAVAVLRAGQIEIARHFKNSGIRVIGSPLYSAPLYHFVHKKHRELVPRLEAVLSEMTTSGEMQRLWEDKFHRLIQG